MSAWATRMTLATIDFGATSVEPILGHRFRENLRLLGAGWSTAVPHNDGMCDGQQLNRKWS